MVRVSFTANLARIIQVKTVEVEGRTLREALELAFAANPGSRGYVLDDQGGVRKHVIVFINGTMAADRTGLSDVLPEGAEIAVLQSLSGG